MQKGYSARSSNYCPPLGMIDESICRPTYLDTPVPIPEGLWTSILDRLPLRRGRRALRMPDDSISLSTIVGWTNELWASACHSSGSGCSHSVAGNPVLHMPRVRTRLSALPKKRQRPSAEISDGRVPTALTRYPPSRPQVLPSTSRPQSTETHRPQPTHIYRQWLDWSPRRCLPGAGGRSGALASRGGACTSELEWSGGLVDHSPPILRDVPTPAPCVVPSFDSGILPSPRWSSECAP